MYKIIYSFSYVLILSLIRGVSYEEEISVGMDSSSALITIVFCADTYLIEVIGKRWEVFALYTLKEKFRVIRRRLSIQMTYLMCLSVICYGLFYWKKLLRFSENSSLNTFLISMIVITGSILFWGILSMTLSNIFRNIWVGIGVSLIMWMTLNSKSGDYLLGKWNVFAYSFKKMEELNSWDWLYGKGVSLLFVIVMISIVPLILKKRG